MSDRLGEQQVTEDDVEAWETLVRAGKTASRGFKAREQKDLDKGLPLPPDDDQ